jgi:hypothetical protein
MSGQHLAEETIQQYVLDRPAATPATIAHLDACAECRTAAAAYGVLVEALEHQPAPVFAFDLAALVTAQLETGTPAVWAKPTVGTKPAANKKPSANKKPAARLEGSGRFWVAIASLLIAAVPAWLFRKNAYFIFSDVSGGFSWLMAGIAGIVVLLSIFRYYRHYQKVLHLINN